MSHLSKAWLRQRVFEKDIRQLIPDVHSLDFPSFILCQVRLPGCNTPGLDYSSSPLAYLQRAMLFNYVLLLRVSIKYGQWETVSANVFVFKTALEDYPFSIGHTQKFLPKFSLDFLMVCSAAASWPPSSPSSSFPSCPSPSFADDNRITHCISLSASATRKC